MTSVERHFMVCGDFNCVAINELDISGLPYRVSEVNQFNKLINDLGLKMDRELFILVKKILLGADYTISCSPS